MSERKHNVCVKSAYIDTGNNDWCEWAGGSVQGWREFQEDAHICKTDIAKDIHLFAVFDGHGGNCVAKFCEKHFVEELLRNENFLIEDYPAALRDTCLRMDDFFWTPEGLQEIYDTHYKEKSVKDKKIAADKEFIEKPNWREILDNDEKEKMVKLRPDAGCTANICLFVKNKVYVANVGDSRTNVLEDNCATTLSIDHKPDLLSEKERVQNAGGVILEGRVNMKLSLTRAIGDMNFKQSRSRRPEEQILVAVPDIQEFEIDKKNNKFIVMGCDGIWENSDADDKNINQVKWNVDKMSLKQIIEERIFDRLMGKSYNSREGTDNMTCIIIKFK